MSVEADSSAPSNARTVWRVVAVACIALAAFAGSGAATCAYLTLGAHHKDSESKDTTVLRGTSAVIVAIRDLAVLQTASYHVERVIDLRDRQSHLFGLFESEDAVLLVAAADIAAGVDLALLRDSDVRVDLAQRTASVSLPPPKVISVRLDNHDTYVHTRSTDMLAVRAKTLETRARQEAESELEQAALSAGILTRARDNAARTVKALVQSFGFVHVQVDFQKD